MLTKKYNELIILDVPRRDQKFPTEGVLEGLKPNEIENYKLSEIVTTYSNSGILFGIQLSFENGLESPHFGYGTKTSGR